MIGTLLGKRYSIESILGEGGMGVVYKAHDTLLDRPVAIKAVSAAMIGDEGARRLLREAQSAAKLTHPNIVAIYDVLEDADQRLIVMEYIAGQTLRERIPMPWQDAVEIVLRICDAIGYAHEHGIIHRDIKPENVLITEAGGVKVVDFGGLARSEGEGVRIAREVGNRSMEAHALTTLGLVTHLSGGREEAKDLQQQAIAVARTTHDAEGYNALGRALNNLGVLSFEEGNLEESLRINQETVDAAKRARDIEGIVFHNAQASFDSFLLGEWERARGYLLDSLQLPLSPTNRRICDARLKWLEGEWESALDLNRELAEERKPFPQWTITWSGQVVWHALDLERGEEAAAVAEHVASVMESDPGALAYYPPFLAVAEALGRAGRGERCEQLCELADEQGERISAPFALTGSALGRATLALHDGEAGHAVQVLEDALPHAERAGPVVKARFLCRLAWALQARGGEGDREKAQTAFEECLQLLEQMGDRRMAGLVRTELTQLGS